MTDKIDQALRERFGHSEFRGGQRQVIESLLSGRDALVVMPTGSGKSLCYQLPALLLPSTTLVVSPLIALMKDQVDALQARDIRATFINSSLPMDELEKRMGGLAAGKFQLVYVAPERFRSPRFLRAVSQCPVSLFAVDEAHCISQWGHDFRPDYTRLADALTHLNRPPVAALTATATREVQDDICQHLGFKDPSRIVTGFNRPNLTFDVHYTVQDEAKLSVLRKLLGECKGSAIIYTGTRRAAEEVADFVGAALKRKTAYYHAGLEPEQRSQVQADFMDDQIEIIVATNAFGMGVDKPNIRLVVHYSMPGTLEAYYQEAGRAGRDGAHAVAALLYSPQDRQLHEWFIDKDALTEDQVDRLFWCLKELAHDGRVGMATPYLEAQSGLNDAQIRQAVLALAAAGAVEDQGSDGMSVALKIVADDPGDLRKYGQRLQARQRHRRRQLDLIVQYAEINACRRRHILKHFGDEGPADADDCCDNCRENAAAETAETGAQSSGDDFSPTEKAALIILHAVKHLPHQVGRTRLAQVLAGSRARGIEEYRWDKTKHYGRLGHFKQDQIRDFADQLMRLRYLKVVGSDRPILVLTRRGETALKSLTRIELEVTGPVSASRSRRRRAPGEISPTQAETLRLFRTGLGIEEIAEQRGLSLITVEGHMAGLIEAGKVQLTAVVSPGRFAQIKAAAEEVGLDYLTPIKERLGEEVSWGEIKCVVAEMKRKERVSPEESRVRGEPAP